MNRKLFLLPLFAVTLLGLAPRAFATTAFTISSDDDSAYAQGTKAMNDQRWSDAVLAFDQVINAKSKKADAALYWKAYALNKLDKQQLAADTCAQLRTQFKDSAWNEDCRALSVSLRIDRTRSRSSSNAQGSSTSQRSSNSQSMPLDLDLNIPIVNGGPQKDPDAEIKILALNAVMRHDPAQAIPLLRGILTGDQPESVKQHALFILAQNNSPEAQAMMRDLVLGKAGPELQYRAIKDCGIYQGKRANDALAEAYRVSSDVQVKRAVISAFFISGDDVHLVEIARQEKDLELKRQIVSQLSLMRGKAANDYMMELLK